MDVTQPSPGTALPERAADTSPEHPWPVRYLSLKVGEYIDRMPVTWVEGQVVQLNRRPGARTAYLTLRDTDADMSLSCSVRVLALDAMPTPLTQGSRVVIQTKAEYWAGRGSLTFDVRQIRPVGVGELLARIEYLKQNLAAEGLFDARRKRPLPFLPRRIGMICGRASAAERDVVENVRRRWPSARFEVRQVAVQGVGAVEEVAGVGDVVVPQRLPHGPLSQRLPLRSIVTRLHEDPRNRAAVRGQHGRRARGARFTRSVRGAGGRAQLTGELVGHTQGAPDGRQGGDVRGGGPAQDGARVTVRDLAAEPVPHLDGARFGAFIAKRFVLQMKPEAFRLIMDGIMLAAGTALLWSAAAH